MKHEDKFPECYYRVKTSDVLLPLEKENAIVTDKERLDFLQKLNDRKRYTGKVVLRESTKGRGWRLHETTHPGAVSSIREAIDIEMEGGNN